MAHERILVVDDEPDLRDVLSGLLEQAGYAVVTAESGASALDEVARGDVDLVITDLRMPNMDGLELLRRLGEVAPGVPAMMLSAYGTIPIAVDAMKLGAKEFLTKPFDRDEVLAIVARTLSAWSRPDAVPPAPRAAGGIVGSSPAMRALRDELALAASSKNATVLLRGETGSGKEVAAQAIHDQSGRKGRFVAVNCGAIPDGLIEAELFGYERGAFTGAVKPRPGMVELADGGTLLLDEVAELPAHLQVKLLRLLATKSVARLGATSDHHIDVRVVAATHQDLRQRMEAGTFREDLFYRLAVIEITVPPLRARGGDVAELARHFCRVYSDAEGKSRRFSDAALEALARYGWPGNVRQLQSYVERLVVFSRAPVIDEDAVRAALERAPRPTGPAAAAHGTLEDARRDAERQRVLAALDAAKGNVSKAARLLEVSRRTMYNKIKELDIPHGG